MTALFGSLHDLPISTTLPVVMEQLAAALYEREVAVNYSQSMVSYEIFAATQFAIADGTSKDRPVADDFVGGRITTLCAAFIENMRRAIEHLIAVSPPPILNSGLLDQAPTLNSYYRKSDFERYASLAEFLGTFDGGTEWWADPLAGASEFIEHDIWVFRVEPWEQLRDALLALRWYALVVQPTAVQYVQTDLLDGGAAYADPTRMDSATVSQAEDVWTDALDNNLVGFPTFSQMPPEGRNIYQYWVPKLFPAMIGYRITRHNENLITGWPTEVWAGVIKRLKIKLSNIDKFRGETVGDWTWSWGVRANALRIPGSTPANTMTFVNDIGDELTVSSGENAGVRFDLVPRTAFAHGPGVKPIGGDPYVTFSIADPVDPPSDPPFQDSEYPAGAWQQRYDLRAQACIGPSVNMNWQCDAFSSFEYTTHG